jgi:hypothetical protein
VSDCSKTEHVVVCRLLLITSQNKGKMSGVPLPNIANHLIIYVLHKLNILFSSVYMDILCRFCAFLHPDLKNELGKSAFIMGFTSLCSSHIYTTLFYFTDRVCNFLGFLWTLPCWRRRRPWRRVSVGN